MIGSTELIIILAIVLVLFGGSRIPKIARSLGAAKKEFEKGSGSRDEDDPADEGDGKADSDSKKESE